MQLLRLAAIFMFVLAALAGFGWGIDWSIATTLGVVAAGLACATASFLTPLPPTGR